MNSQFRDFRRPRSLGTSRLAELAGFALAVAIAQAFAQQPAQQPAPAQRAAAAAVQDRPSFLAEELAEATATVTALDPTKRLISLKADDGREFTVEAGEDVRNFSQIEVGFTGPEGKQRETTLERDEGRDFISQLKPGDRVQLTYGEALAIAVAPADAERALR